MIRFVHLFNYSEGISLEDSEAWYLSEHVPRVRKLPHVVHYRSWRGLDTPIPYPATGVPAPFYQFVRRSELCFDDLSTCQQALATDPTMWAPSEEGTPGFREFECLLLEEEPQYDLLRDAPQEQYKYMTLPLLWPSGRPQIEDTGDLLVDSYYFSYRPGLSIADGEDWYLGHHTREGKQLSGVKHYKTWKSIPVPEDAVSTLRLNRWFRNTELGFCSFEAFLTTLVDDRTRVRFTQSPFGRVLGDWMNIFIRLEDVDDLLE